MFYNLNVFIILSYQLVLLQASLTRQDNTPIKAANPIVTLETTFFYKDAVPSSIPIYYHGPATLATNIDDKHIQVSQTGMIVAEIVIPNNTISANFKVMNFSKRYD